MCSSKCRYIVVLVLFLDLVILTISLERGSTCTTPNGDSAICKSIYNCQKLLSIVRSKDNEQVRFLKSSQCGYDNEPLVCCGKDDKYKQRPSSLPDRTRCGFQETDRIYGGEIAALDEFPWMALLKYVNRSGYIKYSCGGSLISDRYVLTAAHCVSSYSRSVAGNLVAVRLGEFDVRSEIDCTSARSCNRPPLEVEVQRVFIHTDYDDYDRNKHYDIALIKLKQSVSYNNYIRPICLPTREEQSKIRERVVVAGWGKTEWFNRSPIKLKVYIPIHSASKCSAKYSFLRIQSESQICAGGESGRDSCTGDSGGPLMTTVPDNPDQWYVEGIVSYGGRCGEEGSPALYTRVSHFLNWIYATVDS